MSSCLCNCGLFVLLSPFHRGAVRAEDRPISFRSSCKKLGKVRSTEKAPREAKECLQVNRTAGPDSGSRLQGTPGRQWEDAQPDGGLHLQALLLLN